MIAKNIPKQLKHPDYRFYLVGRNKKLPMQKAWNTENNYPFFAQELDEHLKRGGNYGVCTGFGSLIVLDFDDESYFDNVRTQLPRTFTVKTAKSGLYHMYYHLKGEMIKKVGINNKDNERVLDIQAARSGVIAPYSKIDRRFYTPVVDVKIADIEPDTLNKILDIKPKTYVPRKNDDIIVDLKSQEMTIKDLVNAGVQQMKERHFKCKNHPMRGTGNLWVTDDGKIYCFHEMKMWDTVKEYIQ